MVTAQAAPAGASAHTDLAGDYRRVRSASETLAALLTPEDCVIQTMPEVSPTKWHLAHVTWFFEAFCLAQFVEGFSVFDDRYHYLFNSYYYTVGQMHARGKRGLLSRPSLAEVMAYRAHVDDAMLRLIEARGAEPELAFLVTLGLNHEQQHQELLLTDIKHVFFSNPLAPAYAELPPAGPATELPFELVRMSGGRAAIGAEPDAGFCFDNETPRHELLLGDYALGNRLVTNGEFRGFIDDGGYGDPRLWLADGWALVLAGEISRPLYWSDDLEREFTLGGWREVDSNAPVAHVSFYEADAYARWANARLPLEGEWELAAAATPVRGNLLDGGALRPLAAGRVGPSGSDAPKQLFGDVWEWTSSPYVAYPGFEPLAGSLGEYNGKFMSGQMVVRGGSCATWQSHLRATYRSFFYPRDRWQFLGLRLARDA